VKKKIERGKEGKDLFDIRETCKRKRKRKRDLQKKKKKKKRPAKKTYGMDPY